MEAKPLWYKDAILHELHVRAFHDCNADGMGDFSELTSKLDYLQDLGVTAIRLLPFYPSPLRDDGYDIADYTSVHPNYGTLSDVNRGFLDDHLHQRVCQPGRDRLFPLRLTDDHFATALVHAQGNAKNIALAIAGDLFGQ